MPKRSNWQTAAAGGCVGERPAWSTRSLMRYRPLKPCGFRRSGEAGTTLVELIVVLVIVGVLLAVAKPSFMVTFKSMNLSAATSAVTGAIQATRFKSVVAGCQYQLILTQGTTTYQLAWEQPSNASPPTCATTFTNINSAISWSGTGDGISLQSSSVTLQFCPNGTVGLYSTGSTTCTATIPNIVLSNGTVTTNTIAVSGVGNVKVTSP